MTTILETLKSPETNQSQTADSRFFIDENNQDLMIDMLNLGQLSDEVIEYSEIIRNAKLSKTLCFDFIRVGFNDAINSLQNALNIDSGSLNITFQSLPIAPKPNIGALIESYGDDEAIFTIPCIDISAHKVLAMPMVEDYFKPVLDLRIRTQFDKPTSYFKEPGEIVDIPSNGNWYRFELGKILLKHYQN